MTEWRHRRYNPLVIELRKISESRGGKQLLTDFSWQLDDPGNYLLLGPNASGKSLLCSILAGRRRPQRGQVLIDGESVYSLIARYTDQIFFAGAEVACPEADSLELYLEAETALFGGSQQILRENWPLLEELIETGRRTPLTAMSHGQVLLSQVALAGLLPVRLAILDGHLTYLDFRSCTAAERLLNITDRSERFIILAAARLATTFPRTRGRFLLRGGLPVAISELVPGTVVDTALRPTADEAALRIFTVDSPLKLRGISSGAAFTIVSQMEDGLRIRLKDGLDPALKELRTMGLSIRAIEWEPGSN